MASASERRITGTEVDGRLAVGACTTFLGATTGTGGGTGTGVAIFLTTGGFGFCEKIGQINHQTRPPKIPTRQTSGGGKFLSCLSKTSCRRLPMAVTT